MSKCKYRECNFICVKKDKVVIPFKLSSNKCVEFYYDYECEYKVLLPTPMPSIVPTLLPPRPEARVIPTPRGYKND